MKKDNYNQISIFDFIDEPDDIPAYDPDDYLTWCNYCVYYIKGCCAYNVPRKLHCIKGNGFINKNEDPDNIKWLKLWRKARLNVWGGLRKETVR